nr:hypothetical protein [Streptomyces sp. Tu102]
MAEQGVPERQPGRETARSAGRKPDPLDRRKFSHRPDTLSWLEYLRALVDGAFERRVDAARALHVSASVVSRHLAGDRMPGREAVEAMLAACGATEEVRVQTFTLYKAALKEYDTALHAKLEKAERYDAAIETARLAVTRHAQLEAEYHSLVERLSGVERMLTELEAARAEASDQQAEESQELAGRLVEEREARASAELELAARQVIADELQQRVEALSRELNQARQERDAARRDAARLRDELLGVRAHLGAIQAEQDRRRNEDAAVAEALGAVESGLADVPQPQSAPVATAARDSISPTASVPAAAFGANEWLVDEIYQQYLADPNSIDKAWWDFFADYRPGAASS